MDWIRIALVVVVTVPACGVLHGCSAQATPQAQQKLDDAPAALTFEDNGDSYAVIATGDVVKVMPSGRHEFLAHLYDPGFFAKNYESRAGDLFQKDPESGRLYPVVRTFREGFEDAASPEALFTTSRWHWNGADPKRAGRQENYYALGNRVTLSRDVVHGGAAALRCYAVPSAKDVSKASISKGIMYFAKGDDVYFSGWFFIEDTPSVYDGGGFTLFDLESTFLLGSPGLRVIFRSNDSLAFELKLPKTQFQQDRGSEVRFPTGRWVKVETHAFLSDEAGRVRIWQDGQLVLDKRGRTLPLADTVYDRFEIGISAIAQGSRFEKVVYVDDVAISDSPIRD